MSTTVRTSIDLAVVVLLKFFHLHTPMLFFPSQQVRGPSTSWCLSATSFNDERLALTPLAQVIRAHHLHVVPLFEHVIR